MAGRALRVAASLLGVCGAAAGAAPQAEGASCAAAEQADDLSLLALPRKRRPDIRGGATKIHAKTLGSGWCRPANCVPSHADCRSNGFYKDYSNYSECLAACDEVNCVGFAVSEESFTAAPGRCFVHTEIGADELDTWTWTAFPQSHDGVGQSNGDDLVTCYTVSAHYKVVGLGWCRPSGCGASDPSCRTNGFYKDHSNYDECADTCAELTACIGFSISEASLRSAPNRCFAHMDGKTRKPGGSGWKKYTYDHYNIATGNGASGAMCYSHEEHKAPEEIHGEPARDPVADAVGTVEKLSADMQFELDSIGEQLKSFAASLPEKYQEKVDAIKAAVAQENQIDG